MSLQAGLMHLVMLRSGNASFDEPFIVASPFVILIVARSHWHFVSGRAMHRIPAFGCGRGFRSRFFRVRVRFTRLFPLGLFPIEFRHVLRGTTVDDRQFNRTVPHHLTVHGAVADGMLGQNAFL